MKRLERLQNIKIERKTVGAWGFSLVGLFSFGLGLQEMSQWNDLRREQTVWVTNVPAEQMDQALLEINSKRYIEAETHHRNAEILLIFAIGSAVDSKILDLSSKKKR